MFTHPSSGKLFHSPSLGAAAPKFQTTRMAVFSSLIFTASFYVSEKDYLYKLDRKSSEVCKTRSFKCLHEALSAKNQAFKMLFKLSVHVKMCLHLILALFQFSEFQLQRYQKLKFATPIKKCLLMF